MENLESHPCRYRNGTIAGLATITPASGFVGPIGGIGIGLAGGFIYTCGGPG